MSNPKPMTHVAVIRGRDARINSDWRGRVHIRELKNWWVDRHSRRFSKVTGAIPGAWPLYCIELETIRPLKEPT